MKCEEIHDRAFAYLEKDLPAGARNEFDNHLLICHACRLFMADMESLEGAIASERLLEPNPFHETRLLQRLGKVMNPKPSTSRYAVRKGLQLAGIIAGILVAISSGVTLGMIGGRKIPAVNETEQMMSSLKSDLFITDFVDDDKTFFPEK